jgi:SAM-dependent methyltransferase
VPALRLLVANQLEARAVAVVTRALLETQRAFDGVATTYHHSNVENRLLTAMRDRTRAALERAVPAGAHLLNLGCGPGTDDVYFAGRGYRVTAIDWSPAMVEQARRRVARAGLSERVRVEHLGIDDLDGARRLDGVVCDAAYSSFGPLNCVADLGAAARAIAGRVRPGGVLVASVIGRVCPWEIALYASRAGWRRAFVRFASGPAAVPLQGQTVWTRYYSPREFERICAPAGFAHLSTTALGVFTPPPYLQAFADRHRRWIARLQRIEDIAGSWPVVRSCGDHFLMVLRRT